MIMRVSIVIPNYNGVRYIEKCLNSIYRQTYEDFLITIVDNGSSDGSCEIIKREYPKVKLIELDKNYGFSKAVNVGIKSVESEFVVLLNNDTEAEENWLYNLVSCIEKDKRIFSCSSKMIRYNEKNRIDDAGDEYTVFGWAYKCGDGITVDKYISNRKIFSSCAGAAIYRREIFEDIGFFDESFFAYMEDVDLAYRANIYGYKNIYCCGAKIYHIGSATSGSKYNAFKVKLAARNNIYVIYKNMPIFHLIINFPFLLIGTFIKIAFFIFKGFGKEYIKGMFEGFKNLNKLKKVKYLNSNIPNYINIEIDMILNTLKYVFSKLIK